MKNNNKLVEGCIWPLATILDSADLEYFHHCREFYYTVLV